MTRSTWLYLLLGLLLLAVGAALALPLLRRERTPTGQGLYCVDRTNYFSSPSGDGPFHTRFYPTDVTGTARQRPADREIRRREMIRREERS
ncbi:MAG: hypothetical protein IJQ45_09690 [Clostridia bacterium]|nr:hypothetical protein [Clostridia bacterium]